jgi:hypothetical protein
VSACLTMMLLLFYLFTGWTICSDKQLKQIVQFSETTILSLASLSGSKCDVYTLADLTGTFAAIHIS